MKVAPITPDEVALKQAELLPETVFIVFNNLIAQGWQYDRKLSIVIQSQAAYRAAGWDVEYDKPGYNETYGAKFIFRRAGGKST